LPIAWLFVGCGGQVSSPPDATGSQTADGSAGAGVAGSSSGAPTGSDAAGVGTADSPARVGAAGQVGEQGPIAVGGNASCKVVSTDHGDCDAALGWGFNGVTCVALSGCDCGEDCDSLFPTAASCATSCAEAGECNVAALAGTKAPIAITIGATCDDVVTCTSAASAAALDSILTSSLPCEVSDLCPELSCPDRIPLPVDEPAFKKACAASLLPDTKLHCRIVLR